MPTASSRANFVTGKAKDYLRFFQTQVFKHIDEQFNTDPNQRTLFGFSASGTFVAYALLTQPSAFNHYIIGSPSNLFDDQLIQDHPSILKAVPATIDANVFITVGAEEAPDHLTQAIELTRFLTARQAKPKQVTLKVVEAADHGAAFPVTAVQGMFWLRDKHQTP